MSLEDGSFSQAGQESFVLHCLSRKKRGWFLEVGAFHSTELSNTFVLETRYDWAGLAIELDSERACEYGEARINPCHNADACRLDYADLLSKLNAPPRIDYLQIDIEPASQSLRALLAVLRAGRRFSVITFEHDAYAQSRNWIVRARSRSLLRRAGYLLACRDVRNGGNAFEDWWIDPEVIPIDVVEPFLREVEDWRDLFD